VSLVAATAVLAAALASTGPAPDAKHSVYSVGLLGLRHSLKSGEGNEVLGNAGGVALGAGYVAKSWLATGSVDILLGPYEPTQKNRRDVDFYGTGATVWLGFSAQTLDLRSPEGGYGFGLGLSYADTVGRSAEVNGTVPDYVMRISNLSLVPGLFFSWLQPARPRGNTPELLTTRLEGEILSLGLAMPLLSAYSARYEAASAAPGSGPTTQKGRLRGYTLTLVLTGLLGT
jgi:hypothetical protein